MSGDANVLPEKAPDFGGGALEVQDDRRAVGGLVAFVAIAVGSLLIGGLAPLRPAVAAAEPSGQVTGTDGLALYLQSCAACHGPGGSGSAAGPPLIGVGAASADFMLRTGRMPLSAPGAPMVSREPVFTGAQINALVAYVASLGDGSPIPTVQVTGADLSNGRDLFINSCAACHGPGAGGDAVGGGFVAPPLLGVDPVTVGEAIRTGPGVMPIFGPGQISDEELDDIAAYLVHLEEDAAPGGLTIGGSGPVVEGYVAWLVGMGLLLLAVRRIERKDGE
jgi:ubiquinol-cytochrome c reductase cytochrome c subunit